MANPVGAANPNPIFQNPLYRKCFFEKVRDTYCIGKIFFAVTKFFGFSNSLKSYIETHQEQEIARINLKDRTIIKLDPSDIEEDDEEESDTKDVTPLAKPEPKKTDKTKIAKDAAPVEETPKLKAKPAKTDKKTKATETVQKQKTNETEEVAEKLAEKPKKTQEKPSHKRVDKIFKATAGSTSVKAAAVIDDDCELNTPPTPPVKAKNKDKNPKKTNEIVQEVSKALKPSPKKTVTIDETLRVINPDTETEYLSAEMELTPALPNLNERFWSALGYRSEPTDNAAKVPTYWERISGLMPTIKIMESYYFDATPRTVEQPSPTVETEKDDDASSIASDESSTDAFIPYSFKGHALNLEDELPKKLTPSEKQPLKDQTKKEMVEFGKALLERISSPKAYFTLNAENGSYHYEVVIKETEEKPTFRPAGSGILLIIENGEKNQSLKIKSLGLLKNK